MSDEEKKKMAPKTKVLIGILIALVCVAAYFTINNLYSDDEPITETLGAYCVKEIVCGEHVMLNVSYDECVMMYERDLLENNCSYVVVE